MQIDRQIELLGAGKDRPEFLVVEEFAVREPVQHGALEAELCRALELVGGGVRHGSRQRRKTGEARRVLGDDRGETVVDAGRHCGRGFSRQFLRRRRAVREHLNVDAGVVHFLDAQRPEIMQPVELLAGPAGFGADKGFFELFVPIMLFDGDDGTMRFTEHLFPPLAHDPEKWKPVFGQDHAQTRNLADTVVSNSAYPSHLGEQSINVTFS